jgi:hypothetical protein
MSDNNEEEYEGVTINVETTDWPENLVGVVIKEQIVYANDGIIKVIADPIWKFGESDDV